MDLLEQLYEKEWVNDVKFIAAAANLNFRPYTKAQLKNEHDRHEVLPTLDTGNFPCSVGFAQGKTDNWTVYIYRISENETEIANAPDIFHFSRLGLLTIEFGREIIWRDIQSIYALATDNINTNCLDEIRRIADKYTDNIAMAYLSFVLVYYSMVAEEHWQQWRDDGSTLYTQLGKLLKYHSLYRYFIDRADIHTVMEERYDLSPEIIRKSAKAKGLTRDVTWNSYSSFWDKPDMLP